MLPFTLVKKAAIFHLAIYGHFQIKYGTSDSRFYKLTWTMALKLRVLEISQLNFGKSFIFRTKSKPRACISSYAVRSTGFST